MWQRIRRILIWSAIVIGSLSGVIVLIIGGTLGFWWYRNHRIEARYEASKDVNNQPIAARAILCKDEAAFNEALKSKDALNQKSLNGTPPLALAVGKSSNRVLEAMLQSGADPNATGPIDYTVLMSAIMVGDASKVDLLLKYGANPNAFVVETGECPLAMAISEHNGEVVSLLLNAGANPNSINPLDGAPILFDALLSGRPEMVKMLLDAHADPTVVAPMKRPRSAVEFARIKHAAVHDPAKAAKYSREERDAWDAIWVQLEPYGK